MSETLTFPDRAAFRTWLSEHGQSSAGVWLLFGKPGGPTTITAGEALEEALCFGWIDGQMERLDEGSYRKYFSLRRPNSKWSEKNKALAARLEEQGRMTEAGRAKIAQARENGQWDAPKPGAVTGEQIEALAALLEAHGTARQNFLGMSLSVRKTYTKAYLDAKTDKGRAKRLAWMVERLEQGLKPM